MLTLQHVKGELTGPMRSLQKTGCPCQPGRLCSLYCQRYARSTPTDPRAEYQQRLELPELQGQISVGRLQAWIEWAQQSSESARNRKEPSSVLDLGTAFSLSAHTLTSNWRPRSIRDFTAF